MTINVSQRQGVVLLQIARPGIVTTLGLHPVEARNLRDALNGMSLNCLPFFPSTANGKPTAPPEMPIIDCAPYDPNAREVSDL